MAQQAQITSVEAIESFRASLILYLSQMRPVMEEIGRESMQVHLWLQHDRRRFWEQTLRARQRRLEEAQQDLFNATLSKLQESSSLHRMAVQRAQQAVHEAEAKLATIKKWDRDLEDRAAPLTKQIEQMHSFLVVDMGRAVTHLDQILDTLAAYRGAAAARSDTASAPGPVETEVKNEPEQQ